MLTRTNYSHSFAEKVVSGLHDKYPRATEITCQILSLSRADAEKIMRTSPNDWKKLRFFVHLVHDKLSRLGRLYFTTPEYSSICRQIRGIWREVSQPILTEFGNESIIESDGFSDGFNMASGPNRADDELDISMEAQGDQLDIARDFGISRTEQATTPAQKGAGKARNRI